MKVRQSTRKDLALAIERLENRKLLAGDVAVHVTGGGDLVITGDDDGNDVVVRQVSAADEFLIMRAGRTGRTLFFVRWRSRETWSVRVAGRFFVAALLRMTFLMMPAR